MKKSITTISILIISFVFLAPQVAMAVWWNPFTWFKKKPVPPPAEQIYVKPIEKQAAQPVVQPQEKKEVVVDNKLVAKKTVEVSTSPKKEFEKEKVTAPATPVVLEKPTEYAPLKPFIPPTTGITPPETPVFYIQAPDGTMWSGYTKQEAQEKADQYMKSLDTKPPRVNVQKVTDRLLSTFTQFFPDNEFKGVVGLNLDYEDPLPSSGMIKFEYYMDDVLFGSLTNNLGGKITWDTTKYSDGTHTLTGKAYDKAGNVGIGSVEIEIKNN